MFCETKDVELDTTTDIILLNIYSVIKSSQMPLISGGLINNEAFLVQLGMQISFNKRMYTKQVHYIEARNWVC